MTKFNFVFASNNLLYEQWRLLVKSLDIFLIKAMYVLVIAPHHYRNITLFDLYGSLRKEYPLISNRSPLLEDVPKF